MVGSITATRSGARVVELLMPFDWRGMKVEAITLGPIVFDHTLKWKKGEYKEWFDFMVELTSVNGKPALPDLLRQLRYPDADRVFENFVQILPIEMKQVMNDGQWPERVEQPEPPNIPTDEETSERLASNILQPGNVDPLNVDE